MAGVLALFTIAMSACVHVEYGTEDPREGDTALTLGDYTSYTTDKSMDGPRFAPTATFGFEDTVYAVSYFDLQGVDTGVSADYSYRLEATVTIDVTGGATISQAPAWSNSVDVGALNVRIDGQSGRYQSDEYTLTGTISDCERTSKETGQSEVCEAVSGLSVFEFTVLTTEEECISCRALIGAADSRMTL